MAAHRLKKSLKVVPKKGLRRMVRQPDTSAGSKPLHALCSKSVVVSDEEKA
jgi:hypothetical protein